MIKVDLHMATQRSNIGLEKSRKLKENGHGCHKETLVVFCSSSLWDPY